MFRCYALLSYIASTALAFTAVGTGGRLSSTTRLNAAALILQNKGGGHGELGYQLAKELMSSHSDKITSITVLQDDTCNDEQEPFKSYTNDLLGKNVTIIKAPLSHEIMPQMSFQAIVGGRDAKFDYVWDNVSKKPEGASKACVDCAKAWGIKLYAYVSSAGIYTPGPEGPFPMPETTPIKESAGQVKFEKYAIKQGLPLVSFRPQYIYGPKSNKFDYIDYYFDRLVRELPIPIPGDGTQKVSLTNAEDVASLLAAPLNNEEAAIAQRYFNCGTDELHSYDEVAYMCAEAAGISKDDVKIEHFDGDMFGKGNFPFRLTNFYVTPDTAKEKLGWDGAKHNLKDDLSWYYEDYKTRGGPEKKMSLVKDWEIVCGHRTTLPEDQGTIYDKYDPLVLDVSNVKN